MMFLHLQIHQIPERKKNESLEEINHMSTPFHNIYVPKPVSIYYSHICPYDYSKVIVLQPMQNTFLLLVAAAIDGSICPYDSSNVLFVV